MKIPENGRETLPAGEAFVSSLVTGDGDDEKGVSQRGREWVEAELEGSLFDAITHTPMELFAYVCIYMGPSNSGYSAPGYM